MNLKERGFTVGDLLIVTVSIIAIVLIFNRFNTNEKQSLIDHYKQEYNYISS